MGRLLQRVRDWWLVTVREPRSEEFSGAQPYCKSLVSGSVAHQLPHWGSQARQAKALSHHSGPARASLPLTQLSRLAISRGSPLSLSNSLEKPSKLVVVPIRMYTQFLYWDSPFPQQSPFFPKLSPTPPKAAAFPHLEVCPAPSWSLGDLLLCLFHCATSS